MQGRGNGGKREFQHPREVMVIDGVRRGLVCSTAAAAGGALLWLAADRDPSATGGYWSMIGILAGAGLALALILLYVRADDRRLPRLRVGALLTGVLPGLAAAGWVIVAAQPHRNWFRSHVLSWSGDAGIREVVGDLRPYAIVLAAGLGLLVGLAFDRSMPLTIDIAETTDASKQVRTQEPLPVERPSFAAPTADPAAAIVTTPEQDSETLIIAAPTAHDQPTR